MSMKITTISAPAVLGNTRHCLKIGKNAPILVAPEIATKNVKRNAFLTSSRLLQNILSSVYRGQNRTVLVRKSDNLGSDN